MREAPPNDELRRTRDVNAAGSPLNSGCSADVVNVVGLERWFSEADVRSDAAVSQEILAFIQEHEAKTVLMTDRLMGCPHEEGIDYPEGQACPQCPYWAGRNRVTGEIEP